MSEAQKYQGALYREKKGNGPGQQNYNNNSHANNMVHAAYVEDVAEDYESAVNTLPQAPTPPEPVAADPHVNVFDFLVANPTPTASHVSLPDTAPVQLSDDTQLVRFDPEANGVTDTLQDDGAMVQYGDGPIPAHFETPAPKTARKKVKDSDKKDKKRKRLHIETGDQIMTDAPPVLHSGLTGGMNRLMARPTVFPPSPDYSGGDVAETPLSPLKKSKSKHHRSSRASETLGSSLMAMIAGTSKPKSSTKKRTKTTTKSSSTPSKSRKKRSTKSLEAPKEQKLLEFRPTTKDDSGAMVVYKPAAEHFLSFVNKGPESERGCSMNKALKRFHRERSASASTGTSVSKLMEEKELWKSLRMRKNERGEIVLFCIDD
jgi:cell growth-regulating nucleolar protein